MQRLSTNGIEQLVRLVAGEDPPPGAATALHRRTGGDPSQVLIHLLGALCEGRSLHEGLADDGPRAPAPVSGTFRHEGDYWTLDYGGRTVLVRDARGLHYLAPLLRAPGRPIHVLDLVRIDGAASADLERARIRVAKGITTAIYRLRAYHPSLAEHLGTTVRRGYFCRYLPDPAHPVAWEP
jgi:hypothetical protein